MYRNSILTYCYLFLLHFSAIHSSAYFLEQPNDFFLGGLLGAGASTNAVRMGAHVNPATLRPQKKGFLFQISRPFQMKELQKTSLNGFWDLNQWGFGLSIHQFSAGELYLEQELSTQLSFKFPPWLMVGGRFHFRRLEITQFSYTVFPGESMGFVLFPNQKVTFGFFQTDLLSQYYVPSPINPIFQGGVSFSPHKIYTLYFDYRRERNKIWRSLFGQVIKPYSFLQFYVGLANQPFQFSMGITVGIPHLKIFAGSKSHKSLGRTSLYGVRGIR